MAMLLPHIHTSWKYHNSICSFMLLQATFHQNQTWYASHTFNTPTIFMVVRIFEYICNSQSMIWITEFYWILCQFFHTIFPTTCPTQPAKTKYENKLRYVELFARNLLSISKSWQLWQLSEINWFCNIVFNSASRS